MGSRSGAGCPFGGPGSGTCSLPRPGRTQFRRSCRPPRARGARRRPRLPPSAPGQGVGTRPPLGSARRLALRGGALPLLPRPQRPSRQPSPKGGRGVFPRGLPHTLPSVRSDPITGSRTIPGSWRTSLGAPAGPSDKAAAQAEWLRSGSERRGRGKRGRQPCAGHTPVSAAPKQKH